MGGGAEADWRRDWRKGKDGCGVNRDWMALAKLLTFSFCLSVRTFPGLNSGDPDILPLSP